MDIDKLEFNESNFKQIIAKNKCLSEGLKQCEQDKDFVWNLWKEMQVAHPNTVNIVNTVIEREQEKSDIKAAKVLTVLQEKDQQINILQEISADLQIQLKHTNERISELLLKESDWLKREEDFNVEIKHLKEELNNKYGVKHDKDKIIEEVETIFKQEISDLQKKVEELSDTNTSLQDQLKVENENLINTNKEKEDLKVNLLSNDKKLLSVDGKLDVLYKEKEMLVGENEVLKRSLKMVKANLKKKTKEVEDGKITWENEVNKNLELISEQYEKVEQLKQEVLSLNKDRKEHFNCKQIQEETSQRILEQTILIERLEKLQDESQIVLTQQQKTFETELNIRKRTIKDLKKKITELQTNPVIMNGKEIFHDEQNEVDKLQVQSEFDNINSVQKKDIAFSQIENNLDEREAIKSQNLQDSKNNMQDVNNNVFLTSSPKYELEQICNLAQKSTQTTNTCFMKIKDNSNEGITQFKARNEKLSSLVQSMETELKTTRVAHKKRFQRYKFLEENCHLLRQQLSTYEAETEKNKTKIVRASLKSLQREDSTSVWNELEYYRRQYEKFKFEQPKLNEKIDQLSVEHTHYDTLIDQFKIEVDDFKELLCSKDMEIEQREIERMRSISKIKSLEEEVSCCYEKMEIIKKGCFDLQITYSKKEMNLQKEVDSLALELDGVRIKQNLFKRDEKTQTEAFEKVDRIIHKAIVEVIPDQTNSQVITESFFSVASQTLPGKPQCSDNGTQTNETNESIESGDFERNKLTKEIDELKLSCEKLQFFIKKLQQENKKLISEKASLTNKNEVLIECEKSKIDVIANLENTNKKIKNELLENLHTLKETTSLLEKKSAEVEEYSQELNIAISKEQKGKNVHKKNLKEMKSYEKQLEETTAKCSQLSFQVKTLTGENKILADKQKSFQTRVGKLEKDLIQKKTVYDELKLKYEELNNEAKQKEKTVENLKLKFNSVTEREKCKKLYTEELKIKIDTLSKEKCTLEDSITILREENYRKTELLHKTQHLCHQAEVAINEIEQIEQKPSNEIVSESLNQKCVKQLNEFKMVVKKFSEALILKISKNRNKLLEIREQKKKKELEKRQNSLLGNSSNNIACSILGMSTQDLVHFMSEDTAHDNDALICDNDIRNKLAMILKKEVNFDKVLTQFLLDLVKYNENLCDQQKD